MNTNTGAVEARGSDRFSARSHAALGKLYRQSSCVSKAYYHSFRALMLEPELPEAHYQLALLMHEQGEWDLAAEYYRFVVDAKHDELFKAYYNWGLLNQQCGRYSLAAACYHQAIAIQPDYLKPYLQLASMMEREQTPEAEAVEFYQELLTRFPRNFVLHNNIGRFWHRRGYAAVALNHYELAHQLASASEGQESPTAMIPCDLANLWSEHGNQGRALNLYEEAAQYRESPEILGRWAELHLQQGNFAEALRILRKSIAHRSDYIASYCNQFISTTSHDHLAQVRRACAHLLQSLQTRPEKYDEESAKRHLFEIYLYGGIIAREAGNFYRAEQHFHRAIALNPQHVELYDELTACLRAQGRVEAAIAVEISTRREANRESDSSTESPQPSFASRDQYSNRSRTERSASEQSCSVTCSRCMGELIQAYHPEVLARGLYRLGFDRFPHFEAPPEHVERLHRGRAWVSPRKSDWAACHEVIVSDSRGRLVGDLCRQYPWRLPNCSMPLSEPSYEQPKQVKPLFLKGKAALLSTLSGHVYYHWMIDLIPRIDILKSQGVDLASIDWFIVNSIQSDFQRETLTQLGIPMHRVIESDRCPYIQASRLIVPSFAGHLDWVPRRTIDCLRSHFLDSDSTSWAQRPASELPKGEQSGKRIYVSRKRARYRHVLNEAEIEALLAPLGFTTVHLETMTVREQAHLFSQAEIIISPHGSGLTNLVFCKPSTVVVELFAPRYLRTDYWMISQLLGLEHYYIVGRANACRPLRDWMFQSTLTEDIYVELASLRSLLRIHQIQ